MIALLQRVAWAKVRVGQDTIAEIGKGLLVFLGIEEADRPDQALALMDRLHRLRIFEDEAGKMNRSVREASGAVLVVSQFTLAADLSRGLRPSFDSAAPPDRALPIYLLAVQTLRELGVPTSCGQFGARMEVSLCNDGPVTFILEG